MDNPSIDNGSMRNTIPCFIVSIKAISVPKSWMNWKYYIHRCKSSFILIFFGSIFEWNRWRCQKNPKLHNFALNFKRFNKLAWAEPHSRFPLGFPLNSPLELSIIFVTCAFYIIATLGHLPWRLSPIEDVFNLILCLFTFGHLSLSGCWDILHLIFWGRLHFKASVDFGLDPLA